MPFYKTKQKIVNAIQYNGENQKKICEHVKAENADDIMGYLSIKLKDDELVIPINQWTVKEEDGIIKILTDAEFKALYEKV